jgi:hypothetical protein
MRLYTALDEETLRARELLTEWTGDGILTAKQRERLEQETVSSLRTTNIFLRIVLFVFTLVAVGAATGLFYKIFLSHPAEETIGLFSLFFAAVWYGAAEYAVSQARVYHYGIEEAFASCSVGFLCVGLQSLFFNHRAYTSETYGIGLLVPVAGALASLWIWRRFNLWYAFFAAMLFTYWLPIYWTTSESSRRLLVVALYAAGLACVAATRSLHRFDYLEKAYSIVETLIWLGIYLTINLKLLALDVPGQWWSEVGRSIDHFGRPFYWTTWVLTWCLPPVVLARGFRQKDRLILVAGAILAILTLVTNKPYLGWARHTWDPMLLGIALTGVALALRRWLAQGPDGVRHGLTAARLSQKDQRWLDASSAALSLVTPHSITPEAQAVDPDFKFGGGASGGGGASRDF